MLPFTRIEPDNAYCLFFQDRPEGKRFVAGRRVWVWPWWQSWKHVRLGAVEVKIHDLFTTGDNHYCDVDAKFTILVGGSEKGRESRLEKATLSCAPTNDIRKKVERTFFQEWATTHCNGAISRTLQECTFVQLLGDSDFRKDVSVRIKAVASETLLDVAGLIVVDGAIVIEPQEPKGVAATQDVLERWLQYRRTIDLIDIQRLKDQHDTEKQKAEEMKKRAVDQKTTATAESVQLARLTEAGDVEIAEIRNQAEVRKKHLENEKNRTIADIQAEMDARGHESEQDAIRRKAELDEQAQAKKATLDQDAERQRQALLALRREEKTEDARHALSLQELVQKRLDAEGESSRKEADLLDVKQQLDAATAVRDLQQGRARAEVIREEALARAADVIRLRELELAALPKVAEMAIRPLEKMGSVTVHMLGNHDGAPSAGINGLLSVLPTLPLFRECLRFVRDWSGNPENQTDGRIENRTEDPVERPNDVDEGGNAAFR